MNEIHNKLILSIIIPTLNEEKYIEETLKSIKKQKCDVDFEIIVSDNGSTDDTIRIAKKYADKIVFAERRGTGYARNVGARNAEGEYLIFIDADTAMANGCLNEIYKIFKMERYVGFCGSFKFSNRSALYKLSEKCVNFFFIIVSCIGKTIIPGFGFCIPKSMFERMGGFRNVFIEDVDLFEKLNEIGKTKYFRRFHVITSSRRLEKLGILGTLNYYLDISRKWSGVDNFSKRYINVG